MSEAHFQKRVTDLCTLLGLAWHHETDSRRSHAGFPDLVIVARPPAEGVVFAELKTDNGRVRPEQEWWHTKLRAAGVEVHVWRPADWPQVEARIRKLAAR